MKEMRNILGWLGMQDEHRVLKDARKHAEETLNTVSHFAQAVRAFAQGDVQAKAAAITQVRESEHQADLLKDKMVTELSEDLVLPPDREDLLKFVKALDRIADRTNGAAKIVGFIERTPPESVMKNISAGTELMLISIGRLREAIDAMVENNVKTALERCAEVARIEHEADDQKRVLIEAILHANLDPPTLLLTYELAEYLETITDRIEDASDFIKSVAIKCR